MNRIQKLFSEKPEGILSVYFTAGYPQLKDTMPILMALDQSGADMIEVGMPYSDPVADGPTIQESNQKAIKNGITIHEILEQMAGVRKQSNMPIILMGYLNPVLQYGMEKFCQKCEEIGVDGLILPDLPMYEYRTQYKELFSKYGLLNIFLITPQTSEDRIREIDDVSEGFIYMVSSAAITGAKGEISEEQIAYFNRVNAMNLKNPRVIGFGISNHQTFTTATQHAQGAIIGSAFINLLKESHNLSTDIQSFIEQVKFQS